jgi:hypothetical protein
MMTGAASGFFQIERYVDTDVGTAAHAPSAAATGHAEHFAEDVAEGFKNVFDVAKLVRELIGAGMAELIVASPLLLIREDFVGFGGLLELLDGVGVARIAVGVILDRQLAIGRSDLLARSVALHSQDFVIVAFGGHRGHGRAAGSRDPQIYVIPIVARSKKQATSAIEVARMIIDRP